MSRNATSYAKGNDTSNLHQSPNNPHKSQQDFDEAGAGLGNNKSSSPFSLPGTSGATPVSHSRGAAAPSR